MPRKARLVRSNSVQHLISRFVDRRFKIGDASVRLAYLDCAARAAHLWDWRLFSFGLMSSHVHWGVLAGRLPLGPMFKSLHGRYAAWWHRRHGGLGPVFADRPANHETPPDRVGRLVAYHHRNPVRAGVTGSPAESRWTSHRMYLRLDPAPSWLDIELGLHLCGFEDTASGRQAFDEFVRTVDLDARAFDPKPLAQENITDPARFFAPRSRSDWMTMASISAEICGTLVDDALCRRRHVTDARLLMIGAARYLGASNREIANVLGVNTTAISNLVRRHHGRLVSLRPSATQVALAFAQREKCVK